MAYLFKRGSVYYVKFYCQGARRIDKAGTNRVLPLIRAITKIEIDANYQRVREIRDKIGPLLKQLKSLTPQQRERTTEMLYEADELEAETKTQSATLDDRCRLIEETACEEIAVSGIVHPGVTLRFTRLETLIRDPLKGPFKIVSRNNGGAFEVVLLKESGDVGHILDSRRLEQPGEAPKMAA